MGRDLYPMLSSTMSACSVTILDPIIMQYCYLALFEREGKKGKQL